MTSFQVNCLKIVTISRNLLENNSNNFWCWLHLNHFFIFNDNLYRQLDGLSMGLPLEPCMANAFLSAHEINWLHDCPDGLKPLFYKRYVDDTFVIFNSVENANRFVNYLNGKHPNLQFTLEKEDQNRISFLDIPNKNYRCCKGGPLLIMGDNFPCMFPICSA